MKVLMAILLLVVALPCAALAGNQDRAIPETMDRKGLAAMIDQNKGKVIMINFFATWCPPCRAEIPEIVNLRAAFPKDKLLIIGLSVDTEKHLLPQFLDSLKVDYPVYFAARDVTDAFNVSSVPHNAFVAPDGRIVVSEPGIAEFSVLKSLVSELLH